jgi:hypothetical protein
MPTRDATPCRRASPPARRPRAASAARARCPPGCGGSSCASRSTPGTGASAKGCCRDALGGDAWTPLLPHPERDPGLAEAPAALPDRQRLVVFLRYFADLSHAEIAHAAAIEAGTVSATLA